VKRKYLDIEQHTAISAQLFAAEDELHSIANVVGRAYGAPMCDRALKTRRALDRVRIGLGDRFYTEYPDAPEPIPYVVPRVSPLEKTPDHLAIIRRMATTIIDPAIPYVEPTYSGRHKPMMFREHLVVGKMLSAMHQTWADLYVSHLQHVYGKSHDLCNRIKRAIKLVEGLRSALDTKVCGEYPRAVNEVEGVPLIQVYYSWEAKKQERENHLLRHQNAVSLS
jgi:hypothetical protein